MPTEYKRTSTRGVWTQDDLDRAIYLIKNENTSIRSASRITRVPEKTLRNRMKTNDFQKKTMGSPPALGFEAEAKLVEHVKELQAEGFAPTKRYLRKMAFSLAEAMMIKHSFNEDEKMAGADWLRSFLRRNSSLAAQISNSPDEVTAKKGRVRGLGGKKEADLNKKKISCKNCEIITVVE